LTNTDDGLDTPLDLYGDENGSKSDVLAGGNGADKLHGLNKADNLSGGLGNDSIWGGYGDDNLFGEDGGDKLIGEQENNYMEGGAGNDILLEGAGNDTLSGGNGKDIFKFNTAFTANTDKITDFVVADDTIQLENSIFTKLAKTGVLSTDNFIKAAAAHDNNDYAIYNATTGAVTYDADGSGAGAGVQIALLGMNLALTHADFVVI
jgi:Ca2+-binding RTX toxin-like protein